MKKIIKISSVIIGITVVVSGLVFLLNQQNEVKASGGGKFSTAAAYLGGNSATTTPTYLTAGNASSTLSFECEGTESIDINLWAEASTTASAYIYNLSFSYNNVDWFYEDGYTVTTDILVTHGAKPVLHSWTPATTATSSKNISVGSIGSRYCRIQYGIVGGNGSLWSAAVLKKPY